MKIKRLSVIAVAMMLVSCALAKIVTPSTETIISPATFTPNEPTITVLPTARFEPTRTQLAPIKPGTYLVGVDINPGIYRGDVEGELPRAICGWERLKDLSGSVDARIAINNHHGQFYIEIRDSDYAFKTTCELFPLDSIPVHTGNFPAIIKYGMYLVGRDIQAGTYKGQLHYGSTAPCIWERRSNVAGAGDGVIANRHETEPFFVQVAEGDFAFSTTCELERVGD